MAGINQTRKGKWRFLPESAQKPLSDTRDLRHLRPGQIQKMSDLLVSSERVYPLSYYTKLLNKISNEIIHTYLPKQIPSSKN